MIADSLSFLRGHLAERLRTSLGADPEDASADKVVFLDGDKLEPIAFKVGAVTELLINVEQERVMRSADPYVRPTAEGGAVRVQPDLRLILYVLFVARFKQYEQSWRHLSKIIELFQSEPVFEQGSPATLPAGIERLAFELVTLSMAEQNELWSALRVAQHPAILYRVQLLALRDRAPRPVMGVDQTVIDLEQRATA